MRIPMLLLAFAAAACAQLSSWKFQHFRLPNGALVSFISGATLVSTPKSSYLMPDLTGNANLRGNTIEHVIEERGQKVLGYRLRIEPTQEAAYLVTIEPMAGAPFFAQAPKPIRIPDGQRAEIDLATSKDGYVKAVASIQITRYEQRLSDIPAGMAEPHGLSVEALHLMVYDAEVFQNNTRIAEHAGGATAGILVAYLPGVGRVFFSLLPRDGFDLTKTATVENNRIIFVIGSDRYEIAGKGSVIGQPGPWKIYMLRAPDTSPCEQNIDPSRPQVWARTLTPEWLNCQGQ